MQIIPVIDLLDGVVVHAKKGERQRYQPIQSLLTHSSKPLDIVAALLEYFPFRQLYIADLNSIQKLHHAPNNFACIENIAKKFPALELWIDAGINSAAECAQWKKINARLILGSENFSDLAHYLAAQPIGSTFILSLDYMPTGYQGPKELLESTKYWPADVILMSLDHVGTSQGVNVGMLQQFNAYADKFNLYAAGGVRDIHDLKLLESIGVQGALIATALHQKQITPEQLMLFTK